jgi:hypothetical protein
MIIQHLSNCVSISQVVYNDTYIKSIENNKLISLLYVNPYHTNLFTYIIPILGILSSKKLIIRVKRVFH